MPIRPENRELYPTDWSERSQRVRFGRADGLCEKCGRPNGADIRCLPDGRWYDPAVGSWKDDRGCQTGWPDLVDLTVERATRVVTAAAHLEHDPRQSEDEDLIAFCQRCHMIHDRPYHLAMRRITYLMRRALGDLFEGPYRRSPPAEIG